MGMDVCKVFEDFSADDDSFFSSFFFSTSNLGFYTFFVFGFIISISFVLLFLTRERRTDGLSDRMCVWHFIVDKGQSKVMNSGGKARA